jgi:DNA/RNA-binding domain of Phe-tRNA-synthetase-like protein
MKFTIDSSISIKLGYLHLSGCQVAESDSSLCDIYDAVKEKTRNHFEDTPIGEHPTALGVRRLFKSMGIDPTRYRPSGEALVRRIVKDQALRSINCIVDINNICSIESLFPIGVYNRENIIGDVHIRIGEENEIYSGIGRDINIAGKLVSADSEGAFGSPIADSERTKVSIDTQDILVLLYAPAPTENRPIRDTLIRFSELAREHAGAQSGEMGIRPDVKGYTPVPE